VIAAVLLVLAGGAVAVWMATTTGGPEGAPGPGTRVVASDLSKASDAAAAAADGTAERAAADYLSRQPTAYWLTPEAAPTDVVAERIAHLADEAQTQSARIAVVVYGLPGRDCGGHSAGGLDDDGYAAWTAAIGEALAEASDFSPIVILEPDSLALAPECGNTAERVRQLRAAIDSLQSEHTFVYVDGGHSSWLPAAEMAQLISQVRGDGIRGFVTNVSNYNATADEVDYAHEVSRRLGGMHAVIDTSRNGAGSNGEWCNPPERLVGEPGGSLGDDVVDTNLWIKPPGESDGQCNGGPAAGQWWPHAAVELTRNVAG
jgi:endoglucanase